jgi:hypothetical protein
MPHQALTVEQSVDAIVDWSGFATTITPSRWSLLWTLSATSENAVICAIVALPSSLRSRHDAFYGHCKIDPTDWRFVDLTQYHHGRRPGTALKVIEERLTSFQFSMGVTCLAGLGSRVRRSQARGV